MKIVERGMYGYRRWYRFCLMAGGISLGLVMYFLFILSLRISRLPSITLTVFTALAIAPLLPAIVMSFIASHAKTPSEERYTYARRIEDCGISLYDCTSMTKKTGSPVGFPLITDDKCYVWNCGNATQQAKLRQHLEHYTTVDHIDFEIALSCGDKGFFEAVSNLPRFSLDALPKERREKVLKCKRTSLGLPF